MTALDRALPLAGVDRVSKLVSNNLKLDVPRPLDELFQIAMRRTKRAARFRLGRLECGQQVVAAANDSHAAPASTRDRLDDHWITNRIGGGKGLLVVLNGVRASRQNWKPKPIHLPAGADLVSHQANGFRRGTNEFDPADLANFSEIRALGQKAVSRMDGVDIGDLGGADDAWNIEVAVRALRRANTNCLVRKADMQRVPIGFRKHRDRLDAKLLTGVNDSEGDLATVSDEYFLEHRSLEDEWRTAFRRILPVGRFRRVC